MLTSHVRSQAALFLTGLLSLLAAAGAAHAQATRPTPPGEEPLEAYIVFDKQPTQKGMEFDHTAVAPADVTVAGKHYQAWKAASGSWPNLGYGRAFRFSLSDHRFKWGGQPAVDIEVEFWIPGRQSVNLRCDTESGTPLVDQFWGSTPGWRKTVVHLNDVRFANRIDGFDLRLEGYNEDLYIRSIRIKGFDRDKSPDYGRMLRIPSITSDREVFAFPPAGEHTLEYHLRNLARKSLDASYTLTLTDREGNKISGKTGTLQIAGESKPTIAFTFDTHGLKYGVYSVDLAVKRQETGEVLMRRESYIGIVSGADLPKARAGEFYYGLDPGIDNLWRNPRIAAWVKLMGVDIIRGGLNWGDDARSLPTILKNDYEPYRQLGLRVMPVLDPPKEENAQQHAAHLARRVQLCQTLASLKPEIEYYELGNEPDLPFFYPGPIEEYLKDFSAMSAAIKRGNPQAIVANAGLSFAGQTATQRARRFVELADSSAVDAWAYHGHGPGSRAERSAYTRMRATAREFGKGDKLYIETESGVAAREKYQEDAQARTCIQKMVYAQSEHLPLFIWFRLLMFSEDYGNLRTQQEPRPAVLAYRAMVEALRGHSYAATVDLQKPETEAYVFNQSGAQGRAMVIWCNELTSYNVYLVLGPSAGSVKNVRVLDMYGNPLATQLVSGQTIRVRACENPVFVKWDSSDSAFAVRPSPSLLEVAPAVTLVPHNQNPLPVTLRNPLDKPLQATLTLEGPAGTQNITPLSQGITLPARGQKTLTLPVGVGDTDDAIIWPATWSVFVNVDADKVDLSKIVEMPVSLPGPGGSVAGKRLAPRDNKIDFERAGGRMRERNPGFLFAEVESPVAQTLTMGCSADWWMAWYVNGKPVFDTLSSGNGGASSFLDHTFIIPLKAGKNLLAARILSGSQGWSALIGSPQQVKQARGEGQCLVLKLNDEEGHLLVSETSAIQYVTPVRPMGAAAWSDEMVKWDRRDPDAMLDGASVANFFVKEPDSSRWWKGQADLSAEFWLRNDPQRLYVMVKVLDDQDTVSAPGAAQLRQSDSLQLYLAGTEKGAVRVYTIGRLAGKTVVLRTPGASAAAGIAPGSDEVTAQVDRDDAAGITFYRVALDRGILGSNTFRMNLAVNDNDAGLLKQVIAWKPGQTEPIDVSKWYLGVFSR